MKSETRNNLHFLKTFSEITHKTLFTAASAAMMFAQIPLLPSVTQAATINIPVPKAASHSF